MSLRDSIARQLDVDPRDPWALALALIRAGVGR